MAENSSIEWTTHSWNPWRGCTKVSEGCRNCYADAMSKRNPLTLGVWGPNGTRVVASEAMWKEPVKWDRMARDGVCYHCHGKSTRDTPGKCPVCDGKGNIGPHRSRVFCASLADVFEDWQGLMCASDGGVLHACNECGEWRTMERMCHGPLAHYTLTMQGVRTRLFDLIDATPNLDWLLLTKRPENIAKMMPPQAGLIDGEGCNKCVNECRCLRPNVWLGTSVENQAAADERIPHLLRVPAAVRFLSCEPLLGPVDLSLYLRCESCLSPETCWCSDARVNWVIAGGESGHGARPCRVEWIRGIVEQCKGAGVPVFVKQLGSNINTGPHDAEDGAFPRCRRCGHFDFGPCADGTLLCNGCDDVWRGLRDKKGGDISEWPADLRVRQFPDAKVGAAGV